MFEQVSTLSEPCIIVQVFDEHMFEKEFVMSVVNLNLGSDFGAGQSRSVIRPVREAVIRDINSAPSLRAAREVEQEREASKRTHPAFRTKAVHTVVANPVRPVPAASDRLQPLFRYGMLSAIFLAVVSAGFGLGLQLRPAPYAGPTWSHSVSQGESIWALAGRIDSPRPVADVVEDIRVLNNLSSDLIVPGQVLTIPVK